MRRSPQTPLCMSGIWNGDVQCSGLGSILLRQRLQCFFSFQANTLCIVHVHVHACILYYAHIHVYVHVCMYCLILCSLLLSHTTHHFFVLPCFEFGCFSGAPHSCWTLQPALAGRMWILTQCWSLSLL